MSAVEDLRAARAALAEPECWTTDWFARDARGNPCEPECRSAVCWCALGALYRFADDATGYDAERHLRRAAADLFALQPSEVNDSLGHAAVLGMYDRAIERAEAGS